MFDLIASLLAWFYGINNSYAVAIGLLTLLVLVIATPLTLKGTKSMLMMQVLQPELKAIQDKYGKDKREEMNAELMAFYKENNINPVGGCVPMLFQIPVFLVLYRVILGLTRRATDVGSQLGQSVARINSGLPETVFDTDRSANFNPAYLADDTLLFEDLSSGNEMTSLGFDIARSASQVLSGDGLISAFPYLLLVIIVGGTGFVQHHMIRARNTGAVANPTQEMIMKFMPWFLPIFSFTLPAAIVVYFFVSNIYRIGQQYYITRSMYHGEDSLGAQVRKTRENGASTNGSTAKGGSAKSKISSQAKAARGTKAAAATKTAKSSNARSHNNRTAGKKKGKKKSTVASSAKAAAATRRNGAPGRNSSGKQSSARSQVQPRARKKKKR